MTHAPTVIDADALALNSVSDVTVEWRERVGIVTFARPPHNHLDAALVGRLADALETFDEDGDVKAVVLAAAGKCFCAGADFGGDAHPNPESLYRAALRLFQTGKPVVAAVGGAAVGAGLGLALAADFRVAGLGARFAANFVKLGIHPGFGLTCTLPRLVGAQVAADLFLTGRRVGAEEARELRLVDRLVSGEGVIEGAVALASEIAANAPLALRSTRRTRRGDLIAGVALALELELREQLPLFATDDFTEGVRAVADRREGRWQTA